MTLLRPLALLLAAAPGSPGAATLLAEATAAASGGRPVRILLSGSGLAWAEDPRLPAHVDVAVCSRHAREAGWTAASTAAGIRWSSVATWMAELDASGRAALWTVLP